MVKLTTEHFTDDGVPVVGIDIEYGVDGELYYTIVKSPYSVTYALTRYEYPGPKTGTVEYHVGSYLSREEAWGAMILNALTTEEHS